MKALRLMIHGRVQGVWFRATTQEIARKLKLTGWVRNTVDGSVEAHIQGDETAVEKMLPGSPGALPGEVDAVSMWGGGSEGGGHSLSDTTILCGMRVPPFQAAP